MWQLFCVYTLADFAFKGRNLRKSAGSGEAQQSARGKVRVDLYRAVFSLLSQSVFVSSCTWICVCVCVFVGCVCLNGDVSSCFLMSCCLLDLIKQKTAARLPC